MVSFNIAEYLSHKLRGVRKGGSMRALRKLIWALLGLLVAFGFAKVAYTALRIGG